MVSVVLPITSIPLAVLYFLANTFDISSHMKISVINPVTNVFVCGYYDGLHEVRFYSIRLIFFVFSLFLTRFRATSLRCSRPLASEPS